MSRAVASTNSTKPVRKSSEGRVKKQIVPYGTYSSEDLFLNVHILSSRGDGVLGVMFARARIGIWGRG